MDNRCYLSSFRSLFILDVKAVQSGRCVACLECMYECRPARCLKLQTLSIITRMNMASQELYIPSSFIAISSNCAQCMLNPSRISKNPISTMTNSLITEPTELQNMLELMIYLALNSRLATYIVRSQSDAKSCMTPSMHPRQRTIMHNQLVVGSTFELMIVIELNTRLATSFVLRVTRRRQCHRPPRRKHPHHSQRPYLYILITTLSTVPTFMLQTVL